MKTDISINRTGTDNLLSPRFIFTIFIPTYNRGTDVAKTIQSVEKSYFRNFEVIIVDDGSNDRTYLVVAEERKKNNFPLTYVFQKNCGKAGAHNTALQYARGEFFMNLDAGDLLLPDAMSKFFEEWESIPVAERPLFAGVSALCLSEDGTLSGEEYPDGIHNISYLELDANAPISGEKRQAIRTTILRQFPYPRFPGEKHVRPDLILRRMAHQYKLRLMNRPVQINIREPDGITANITRYRMENPKSFRLFYLEEITLNRKYYDNGKLYGDNWRYIRFSFHSGIKLGDQIKEVHDRLLWAVSIPQGTIKWLIDRYRMRGRKYRISFFPWKIYLPRG